MSSLFSAYKLFIYGLGNQKYKNPIRDGICIHKDTKKLIPVFFVVLLNPIIKDQI